MQDPKYVKDAFSGIAKKYVITNHILSLGIDILWRKKTADIVYKKTPKRILDLATGSGDLALAIEKKCKDSEVVCSDFCAPMLEIANSRGLNTVLADAMSLPFEDRDFDLISVGFGLRNMEDWSEALVEMRRVLKPDGHIVILDFSLPDNKFRRALYCIYLNKILPFIAGVITRKRSAYKYLAKTIGEFPSGKSMCNFIESNGFIGAEYTSLSFGVASIYIARRAEEA